MKRWKLNIAPWYSLGLVAVLVVLCLIVSTGTTWARYRTETSADISYNVRNPVTVYLGKVVYSEGETAEDPEVAEFVQTSEGAWIRNEDGHLQLDFAVANGLTAKKYEKADQQVRVRLISSLGLQSADQKILLKVPIPKEESQEETTAPTETTPTETTPTETTPTETTPTETTPTETTPTETTPTETTPTETTPTETTPTETTPTETTPTETTPTETTPTETTPTETTPTETTPTETVAENPQNTQQEDPQEDQEEGQQEFEIIEAKAVPIEAGSFMHTAFGEGWVFCFVDKDGKELGWTLEGGALSFLEMHLIWEGGTPADTSLLQLQIDSRFIKE